MRRGFAGPAGAPVLGNLLMVAVLVLNFGIRLVTGKRVVQAARAD